MEVSGQLHAPTALLPTEAAPGTHWIGGWVGPRADVEEKNSQPPLRIAPRSSDRPSHILKYINYEDC
jgi:hypothetical protein